jgi:hypothetical protein
MTGNLPASIDVLRQFARAKPPVERCDLCGLEVPARHTHLLDRRTRNLACACAACAVLFSGQENGKYKRVPDRIRYLAGFRLSDAQWESLMIPINMAFFHRGGDGRPVAIYPSPAGPIESLLELDAWSEIAEQNPVLRDMQSEVEALLVNRLGHSRGFEAFEYYLTPIDECYTLVGLIRRQWRGLSGGMELWGEIQTFFGGLKARSDHA